MKKLSILSLIAVLGPLACCVHQRLHKASPAYWQLAGNPLIVVSIVPWIALIVGKGGVADRLPAAIKWQGITLVTASVVLGFIMREWSSAAELIIWRFGMQVRSAPLPAA